MTTVILSVGCLFSAAAGAIASTWTYLRGYRKGRLDEARWWEGLETDVEAERRKMWMQKQ